MQHPGLGWLAPQVPSRLTPSRLGTGLRHSAIQDTDADTDARRSAHLGSADQHRRDPGGQGSPDPFIRSLTSLSRSVKSTSDARRGIAEGQEEGQSHAGAPAWPARLQYLRGVGTKGEGGK